MSETTSVFRSAQPTEAPQESPVSDKPVLDGGTPVETHIDSLLATYQDDQGKPYVAKYLELDEVWNKEESLKNELETFNNPKAPFERSKAYLNERPDLKEKLKEKCVVQKKS